MPEPAFDRVAILGLGLIGGSLSRSLAQGTICNHIAAFDISCGALEYAEREGFIHSRYASARAAVQNAQLIVFAAPPSCFDPMAREIAPYIIPGAIVTDVGSVKRQAIRAILPHIPPHAHFVAAHPIAGSEKTGVEAGSADLFRGRRVILTPEEKEVLSAPVKRVSALWQSVGAKTECMPAELHDHIYAYVSHLPQLVAFAASDCPPFARLAQSDAALWADICVSNADFIGEALSDFIGFAAQIAGELSTQSETRETDVSRAGRLFAGVAASCLIATASLLQERAGVHPAHYAGQGFADMTAPAQGDMHATLAAISEHPAGVSRMLQALLQRLQRMQDAVATHNGAEAIRALKGL